MTAKTQKELEEIRKKLERIDLLEKKKKLFYGLPHMYGFPWYTWAKQFHDSRSKIALICAANQISKSSTQIRTIIDWCTNPLIWKEYWKTEPRQFWYLYPTKEVAHIEWEKKWKTEFMPRGDFKEHPQYGWREEIRNKNIFAVHFNTGVTIYFKTYAQDVQHLQTGTCHGIFCDEELPVDLYDELMFRLTATDGYFRMVFTATLGQEFWKEVIEDRGSKYEKLKEAQKFQVSMFDCLYYNDGTPAPWSLEKIQQVISRCKSPQEVLRRVYGKFVVDEGLKYPSYTKKENMIAPVPIPSEWRIYGGLDYGSGGSHGHPSAMVFVAVRPDNRLGYVFKAWRGDEIQTTATDTVMKFLEMREGRAMSGQFYDHSCADMKIIAARMGEPFIPADKGHETGENIVNVLFKNKMLMLFSEDDEIAKLSTELGGLMVKTPKTKAKDDLVDALRYCVTKIPWDWSIINEISPSHIMEKELSDGDKRRKTYDEQARKAEEELEEEFTSWNELYEV